MCDEITYPSPNLIGTAVGILGMAYAIEVWEWISNLIFHTLLAMWLIIHAEIKIKPCMSRMHMLEHLMRWQAKSGMPGLDVE